MKILASKIVNGKKMFLIEDNDSQGRVFAQDGKPIKKENISYYNPYYVDIKGINSSDNVSTKLTPSKKITPQELKQIKESPTNVGNIALKEKQEKAQRLKEAEEAYQKRKSGAPVTLELLAQETQAIGDKISLQNIPGIGQYVPDILDVTGGIGSMASGLGAIPLNLNRGNYGQALLSVASPLATGALAGVGSPTVGQFVNNVANPFAGTGDLINNLGNKYLPNAYKLNPFANKGTEGFTDLMRIQQKGDVPLSVLAKNKKLSPSWMNSEQAVKTFEEREKHFGEWFTKDKTDLDWYKADREFSNPEIINLKVPNYLLDKYSVKNIPTANKLSRASDREFVIPKSEQNNFKPNWLRGYKQIDVPKPSLSKEAIRKQEFGGKIKVLDTKIENNKKYFLINDIEKNNTFEKGGTVSDIYKQKTGKNWNTAKLEGLTTGSYEDNIKLKNRLLSGEFDNKQVVNSNTINNQDYTKAKNFNEAFKIARKQLGANQIFEYQGRKYGTNIVGEKFEPSKDVLEKAGMNTTNVKKSLHEQNKLVNSVYSTKKTTKLEPEYQDWEKIKQRQQEINKMNQADIIKEYHKGSNEQYLVLDKKRGKLHLYQGDKEITSYNVGIGENAGDEQTKIIVKNGKVYWEEGNKMTGAGIYTVSGVNPKNPHYSNAPTWNFKNEQGIEVPMAIHSSFGDRTSKIKDNKEDNNRLSNGCINGICYNLEELYKKGYKQGQKLYVLPDDDTNKYEIKNGKLVFSSKNPNVNRTVNTLNYKPIQIQYNKSLRENAPEVANMTQAIVNNKQKLMKELKINGDVYNELAKLTLGLAGQESKYGTSFKFKAKTELIQDILKNIIGNKSYNSKGLTQIKYDGLNDEVKKIFKEYNITKENLNQGDKAALAQIILLSHMYNNELPAYRKNIDEMGISDIDALLYLNQGKRKELINKTATPEKNTYIQSVKKFAEDFKIKQLN